MRLAKYATLVLSILIVLVFIPGEAAAQFYEDIEWEIFEMVNDERSSRGFDPLQMDSKLRQMARDHSKDMGDNQFYDHTSPTTGTFEQRFNANNLSGTGGENVHKFLWGSAQTAMYGGSKVVNGVNWNISGWKDSEPHWNNILNSNYDYIGIGVYRSNDGEYSYTQVFNGAPSPPGTILQPPQTTPDDPEPTIPPEPKPIYPSDGDVVSGTSITFQWEPSPGATYYIINIYRPDIYMNFCFVEVHSGTSHTCSYFINDGTEYMWSVAAGNDAGLSHFEPGGSFTNAEIHYYDPTEPSYTTGMYRQDGAGNFVYWAMNEFSLLETRALGYSAPSDEIAAVYCQGNGRHIIYWQVDSNNHFPYWVMDDEVRINQGYLSWHNTAPGVPHPGGGWSIGAVQDMTGNGTPDVIFASELVGGVSNAAYWQMNGFEGQGASFLTWKGSRWNVRNWSVAAIEDMDGSGSPEVIWQIPGEGKYAYWKMNGFDGIGAGYLTWNNQVWDTTPWELATIFDMNRNGKREIVWQEPGLGLYANWFMNNFNGTGSQSISSAGYPLGANWPIVGVHAAGQ